MRCQRRRRRATRSVVRVAPPAATERPGQSTRSATRRNRPEPTGRYPVQPSATASDYGSTDVLRVHEVVDGVGCRELQRLVAGGGRRRLVRPGRPATGLVEDVRRPQPADLARLDGLGHPGPQLGLRPGVGVGSPFDVIDNGASQPERGPVAAAGVDQLQTGRYPTVIVGTGAIVGPAAGRPGEVQHAARPDPGHQLGQGAGDEQVRLLCDGPAAGAVRRPANGPESKSRSAHCSP